MTSRHKLVLAATAALAVGGGGAAVAASQLGSPRNDRDAVIADAAQQLGVEPQSLRDALTKALQNRVDAAVADGRLTEERAERLKARIAEGRLPLLGHGKRWGDGRPAGPPKLRAASEYLGLSPGELRRQLREGKSLADVARAEGKSVDGLVAALRAEIERRLDAAVQDGRLTAERRDAILERLEGRLEALVEGDFRRGFGHRGPNGERPPAWAPRG